MKKIIAALLSIVMIVCTASFSVAAKGGIEDSPVIIIPGFMQCSLYTGKNAEKVWCPEIDTAVIAALKSIFLHLPTFGNLNKFIPSPSNGFSIDSGVVGDLIAGVLDGILPVLECKPDGSSAEDVYTYEKDPAKRSFYSVQNSPEKINMQAYYTFEAYLCDKGYRDAKDIFTFEYDGRKDAVTLAEELRAFVKDVKTYTGKDKVSLFGVSYGGQIAEAYLHLFMNDGDVDKVVMNAPSLKGTDFVYRIFSSKVDAAVDEGMDLLECVLGCDTELFRFFRGADMSFISGLLNSISDELAYYFRYWPAVYSLTDTEHYELLKERYLDPTESAEIIRKNDIVHYEIMPEIKNTLQKCKEKGIDVAVYSNSGIKSVLGGEENSDLLLSVEGATGATTATRGECFMSGFDGVRTSCDDEEHYHISPSMEVDASSAYLPENTWFVDGSHHAMFQYENYGLELNAKLLCTDELKDVHSSVEYPQFMCSRNAHRGVYARFDKSLSGYVSQNDNTLTVENIYKNNGIKILSVKVDGADVSFKKPDTKILLPGDKMKIGFDGKLPSDISRMKITVKYTKLDTFDTVNERTFDFSAVGKFEKSPNGGLVENEFYDGDMSGISLAKRLVYRVIYLVDITFAIADFMKTEAFGYLF